MTNKFFIDHPELLTDHITCDICGQKYKYACVTNHRKTKIHKIFADMKAQKNMTFEDHIKKDGDDKKNVTQSKTNIKDNLVSS